MPEHPGGLLSSARERDQSSCESSLYHLPQRVVATLAPCVPIVAVFQSARWLCAMVRLAPGGAEATSRLDREKQPAMAKASSISSGRGASPWNPAAHAQA